MTTSFIILLILTGVFAILSGLLWKKNQAYYERLLKGGDAYNEMQRQLEKAEKQLRKYEQKTQSTPSKEKSKKEEKAANRSKFEELTKEIDTLKEKLASQQKQFTIEKDTLKSQTQALTKQLHELDQERHLLSQKLHSKSAAQKPSDRPQEVNPEQIKSLEASLKKAEAESQDLKKELNTRTKELNKLKAFLEKLDPKSLLKHKRQHQQYARLYTSMKGLKEMAEERSQNWEIALKALSLWVLKQNGQGDSVDPKNAASIAPLVAKALETIDAELVNDAFSSKPVSSQEAPLS